MTSPRQNVSPSKSSHRSKLLVFGSLEEMGGSMSAQGSFPHAPRPKLVAVEASKALFGVTFVYRVLRVITTNSESGSREVFSHNFVDSVGFYRSCAVRCPWSWPNTVFDTEIEPPHAGIGWKLTSVGPDLILIELPEIFDKHAQDMGKPFSSRK